MLVTESYLISTEERTELENDHFVTIITVKRSSAVPSMNAKSRVRGNADEGRIFTVSNYLLQKEK